MGSKNRRKLLRLLYVLVICACPSSDASFKNAGNWRDFGDVVVYFWGGGSCPLPDWLARLPQMETILSAPDSPRAVAAVEDLVQQVLDNYQDGGFVTRGRVVLNRDPRCILGLYLVGSYPGSAAGRWASRAFERVVERSCLVNFGINAPWKQRLGTELVGAKRAAGNVPSLRGFDSNEVPFLLIYVLGNADSPEAGEFAGILLAEYLVWRKGLEPALRLYRRLLLGEAQAKVDECTQLKVAKLFEQTGAAGDAEQLFYRILQNTHSPEAACAAAEHLARSRLAAGRHADAAEVLSVLQRRFPDAWLTDEQLYSLFTGFRGEERADQLVAELQKTEQPDKSLLLCTSLNKLWSEKDRANQWQVVVEKTEPSSTAGQCGRLYLAESFLAAGKLSEAEAHLLALYSSENPLIKARAVVLAGDIALARGKSQEAIKLYWRAAQIQRGTELPTWLRALDIESIDTEELGSEDLTFLAYFLRGFNELADADYDAALWDLSKAKKLMPALTKSTRVKARRMIPAGLMLAHLRSGDCARAERDGFELLNILEQNHKGKRRSASVTSQAEQVEHLSAKLSMRLRDLPEQSAGRVTERHAIEVHNAVTSRPAFSLESLTEWRPLVELFWRIKRQRVAQLLAAECDWARTRPAQSNRCEGIVQLEPVLFVAQMLRYDSFENIREVLTTTTPSRCRGGQMYRFAKVAQKLKRPYMVRMALDATMEEIGDTPENTELLAGVAGMYLAAGNYQKAIDVGKSIVAGAVDGNEAQGAQLNVIGIYADKLKLYDKAVEECQNFLTRFANGPRAAQVEFLIGKLAYLDRDYAAVVGQMDLFERRYPQHPQVVEAMMLAALSRMSEGNIEGAIDRFGEVIRKYPESEAAARSKFLIGYAQVSAQKYSEALETFRQYVEQFPNSRQVDQAQGFIERLSKVSQ